MACLWQRLAAVLCWSEGRLGSLAAAGLRRRRRRRDDWQLMLVTTLARWQLIDRGVCTMLQVAAVVTKTGLALFVEGGKEKVKQSGTEGSVEQKWGK